MDRVPKGFRVPGLQEGKFRALGLHLAQTSIFVWAPSQERLWALGSTTKISGLLPLGPYIDFCPSFS